MSSFVSCGISFVHEGYLSVSCFSDRVHRLLQSLLSVLTRIYVFELRKCPTFPSLAFHRYLELLKFFTNHFTNSLSLSLSFSLNFLFRLNRRTHLQLFQLLTSFLVWLGRDGKVKASRRLYRGDCQRDGCSFQKKIFFFSLLESQRASRAFRERSQQAERASSLRFPIVCLPDPLKLVYLGPNCPLGYPVCKVSRFSTVWIYIYICIYVHVSSSSTHLQGWWRVLKIGKIEWKNSFLIFWLS